MIAWHGDPVGDNDGSCVDSEPWRIALRDAGIVLPTFAPECKETASYLAWVESLRPGDYADLWADGDWRDAYISDGDTGRLEVRLTQSGGASAPRWVSRLLLNSTTIRPSTVRQTIWRRLLRANDIVEHHGFGRWRWAHVAKVHGDRLYLETTAGCLWSYRSDPLDPASTMSKFSDRIRAA